MKCSVRAFPLLTHSGHVDLVLLASPVRGNVRRARPTLSILRLGETNDFASNFRRMRYCGFWIVHDDIRRVGSEAIDK
jgi:hypothetical protein